MPHLFTSRKKVNGVITVHCSWCGKRAELSDEQ
jgi:hypothetical protein